MNGYRLMAESYKKLMQQGKIDESAKKEIRIYEFLADCDTDDFCIMADSSAFNGIMKAYLRMAVESAKLEKASQDNVMRQIERLLDERSAEEVLIQYFK